MPNAGRETAYAPWVTCTPDSAGWCNNPIHRHEPPKDHPAPGVSQNREFPPAANSPVQETPPESVGAVIVAAGDYAMVSTPRMEIAVQVLLAGREPLRTVLPFEPTDEGAPAIATALQMFVNGVMIVSVPFANHGAGLHTICTRDDDTPGDPADDRIDTVVTT